MCSETNFTGTALQTESGTKNVLGFDPYMVPTYKDRDLRKAVALEKAKAPTEAAAMSDPKMKKPICTIWIIQACLWLVSFKQTEPT